MRRLTMLALWFITAILCGSLFAASTQPTIQSLNKMPLSFTKNMGQWDDRVLFRANAGGATMWFTKEGVTYQFTRRIDTHSGAVSAPGVGANSFAHSPRGRDMFPPSAGRSNEFNPTRSESDSIEQLVLTAKFIGANPNPEVVAEGQMEYRCNYFLGNDPSKRHTDVPNYEAITLKDIYPGIDVKFSGDGNGQAAYEFIVAPGADIAQVKVAYEGADETSIDADGRMILHTKWGDMTAAMKSPTDGVLSGNTSCAWWTSSSITSSSDLAHVDIRQVLAGQSGTLSLSYSTYLGGGGNEEGEGIAVDDRGNAYVTGWTQSSDFPTQNPYQTHRGGGDVFVTKLSPSGTLIYSTYLGGSNEDYGYGIAIYSSGEAYLTGTTGSSDFPTLNPYQTDQGGGDVFVTKLSGSGDSLLYSTYLGGEGGDYGRGIAVDGSGNAYVTGYTLSSNFPTLNPYQSANQGGSWGYDAFVTKLNSSGNSLIYSTYLGGESDDYGNGITVDDSGDAYMTGATSSSDFPTLNPLQAYQGGYWGCNAFVSKLGSNGNNLIYSTFLGGNSADWGASITIDGDHNVYVTGGTSSLDFPTLNPYQTSQGGHGYWQYDAFVAKLASSGTSLIYSTYLGGRYDDYGRGIAVDGGGNACVTGMTLSPDFPVLNPSQSFPGYGISDAFVTKLNANGNIPLYSTYLGGIDYDEGLGIAVDDVGNACVTGNTFSSDFPILNPYQGTDQGGSCDAFVTKLSWTPNYPCGDVNTDEQVNLIDAVFLINYIFVGGPAPQQLTLADVNCSGSTNIADVVLLINYIFRAGPVPCAECE